MPKDHWGILSLLPCCLPQLTQLPWGEANRPASTPPACEKASLPPACKPRPGGHKAKEGTGMAHSMAHKAWHGVKGHVYCLSVLKCRQVSWKPLSKATASLKGTKCHHFLQLQTPTLSLFPCLHLDPSSPWFHLIFFWGGGGGVGQGGRAGKVCRCVWGGGR